MTARTGTMRRRGLPSTAGVAAPGDKRFRRPDVRPATRQPIGPLLWTLARGVAGIAVALAVAYAGVKGAARTRLFSISRIAVRGNTWLSTSEVEALVGGLRGQSILRIDLDEYREKVLASPWVASAMVRRVLPRTVEVRIIERSPMAIARLDGALYLVDQAGVIIDAFGPRYSGFDLPVVDGLVKTPADGPPVVDDERAELTQRFLAAVQSAPALRQRVSQIDASDAHDLVVLLDDDPTLVHLGDTRFVERLKTYEELAPTLQDRLSTIDYVDMRFDERVYVRSKVPPVTAAQKKGRP